MSRFTNPVPQFWLDDGTVASSGRMKFFANKDYSTLKDTFSLSDNTAENTNPVVLDGQGRMPPCFGEGLYSVKFYAYDPDAPDKLGTLQWTRDDVNISELSGQFSDWNPVLTYGQGDIVKASNGQYYRSLVGTNTAHDPISSAVQWEKVVFITEYNANRTYQVGDPVILAGKLYSCNTASTVGISPPAAQWDNLTFNGVVAGNLTVSGSITAGTSVTAASYIGGNLSKTTDIGITYAVVKQTATSRSSTTTLAADPILALTGLSNGDYHVKAHINWTGNGSTTNGIKFALDYTTGLTRSFVASGAIGSGGGADSTTLSGTVGAPGAFIPSAAFSYDLVILIDAVIRLDAGGTIFFTWAQQVSGATATAVNKGTLTATRLT